MKITVLLKDGSRQIISPKTEGENRFNGSPESLAKDLFGDQVKKVTF